MRSHSDNSSTSNPSTQITLANNLVYYSSSGVHKGVTFTPTLFSFHIHFLCVLISNNTIELRSIYSWLHTCRHSEILSLVCMENIHYILSMFPSLESILIIDTRPCPNISFFINRISSRNYHQIDSSS